MDLDAIFDRAHGLNTAPQQVEVAPAATAAPAPTLSLDAIFDAAHAKPVNAGALESTPSIWKNPVDAITSSDWWLTRPDGTKPSLSQSVLGPVVSMGDWLGVDEGLAALTAGADKLQGEGTFSESYDKHLANLRGAEDSFRAASPLVAAGLDVAGAVKAIPSAISKAPTLAAKTYQAAKEGLAAGTLFGFGSGRGTENRLTGAAIGGGLGLATGAIAVPVLEGAAATTRAAADWLAEKGVTYDKFRQGIDYLLKSEKGAIGEGGAAAAPGLSNTELFLARNLKNVPSAAIDKADEALKAAEASNTPLFLPEALESPKIYRNARMIANYDPSMEFSQRAIRERADDAIYRGVSNLDNVSTTSDAFEGASKLVGAADDIVKGAESARMEEAKVLYGEAYMQNPTITSPQLTDLMENDKVLQKAISSVKQTYNNANMPDNATPLLVKARSEISNKIDNAIANGRGREARDLTDTYNRLNGIIQTESPYLKAADQAYEQASRGIDELNSTFLKTLRDVSPDKVKNIGQIFNLPASRIADLRNKFIEKNKLEEWNAGIRSHLQNTIEGTIDGRNFVTKIAGNTVQREKLQAALGDRFENVIKGLSNEDLMFKGKNLYDAGPRTAGNLEEREFSENAMNTISQISRKDWQGLISKVFGPSIPDDIAQGMAEIYFGGPSKGLAALEKVGPLVKQYGRNKAAIDALGSAAETATTRLGGAAPSIANENPNAQGQLFASTPAAPQPQTPGKVKGSSSISGTIKGATVDPISFLALGGSSGMIAANPDQTNTPKPSILDQAFNEMGDSMKLQKIGMNTDQPRFELPDTLIKAVITQESSGNKKAVSKKGAEGLMQLMPATGKEWHKKLGIEDPYDPFDPEQNRKIGTAYLEYLVDMYDGDLELALTAYNQGFGRVNKLLARNKADSLDGIIDDLGPDGKKYAKMILNRMKKFEQVMA